MDFNQAEPRTGVASLSSPRSPAAINIPHHGVAQFVHTVPNPSGKSPGGILINGAVASEQVAPSAAPRPAERWATRPPQCSSVTRISPAHLSPGAT